MKTLGEFVEGSSIIGLKEAYSSKSLFLKLLWSFFVFVGIGLTGYFIFKVFEEYRENKTATKVNYRKIDDYQLPPISVCPPYWIDNDKLAATNLSQKALHYAFSFVLNQFKETHCNPKAKDGAEEFNQYMRLNKMNSIIEFYEQIAFDYNKIFAECEECIQEKSTKHYTYAGICHVITFESEDIQQIGSDDYKTVVLKNLNITNKPIFMKIFSSYMLHVDPDPYYLHQHQEIPVETARANVIYVRSRITIMMDRPERPCLTEEPKNYSQNQCISNCVALKRQRYCNDCVELTYFSRPLNNSEDLPLCNRCNWKARKFNVNCNLNIAQVRVDCTKKCPPLCEQVVHQLFIAKYGISSVDDSYVGGFENQSPNTTEIFISYKIDLNGMEIHEEYAVYSTETMISNVGGVLGLWVGASIMTLVQVLVFVVRRLIMKFFDLNCCCSITEQTKITKVSYSSNETNI